jgi:hypothetical protein
MRDEPRLDSRIKGVIRSDFDYIITRILTDVSGKRKFYCFQLLEVKERGAIPDKSQFDVMSVLDQIICRSATKNMHGAFCTPTFSNIRSTFNGQPVNVRYLGYHLLQLSGTNPLNSHTITWSHVGSEGRNISVDTLVDLLSMTADPFFREIDMRTLLRDRHRNSDAQQGLLDLIPRQHRQPLTTY